MIKRFWVLCTFLFALPQLLQAAVLEGKGILEEVGGQQVLHVQGTSYEMGYQHGRLLKEQIQKNIATFVSKPRPEAVERIKKFQEALPGMLKFIPYRFLEEMRGLADGAEVPYQKILSLNLFPEMFHCTGLTASGEATKDGELFHVRALDYAIGKNLQETAVLIVAKPDEGYPFVNVSYAGFIGSVTGMNKQKIAIGEIGGAGYGHWEGVPMAFLMRMVLEQAGTLDEAKSLLADRPRTCEYYYVISDGKDRRSCGVYATAGQMGFIEPGASYAFLKPRGVPLHYGIDVMDDKFFLSAFEFKEFDGLTVLFDSHKEVVGNFFSQPKDCLAVVGCSNYRRYPVLIDRLKQNYGNIDAHSLMEIIKRPVAHDSNLHNAIFAPGRLEFWVAHAGRDNTPACDQPYVRFSLDELLDVDLSSNVDLFSHVIE